MSKKVDAWEMTRALDRIAIPLIPELGVDEAYRRASEQLDIPQRPEVKLTDSDFVAKLQGEAGRE